MQFLREHLKNEIIMLLGAALGAGGVRVAVAPTGRNSVDAAALETADDIKEPDDPTMMELVDNWG